MVVTVLSVFAALFVHSPDEEGTRWWHDIDHDRPPQRAEPPTRPPMTPPEPLASKATLEPEDIEAVAANTRTLTGRCWSISLKHRPLNAMDVKRVVATLAVQTDGRISHVDLAGVPDDDGGLRDCLLAVVGSWRMPATRNAGSYDVTLAFQ